MSPDKGLVLYYHLSEKLQACPSLDVSKDLGYRGVFRCKCGSKKRVIVESEGEFIPRCKKCKALWQGRLIPVKVSDTKLYPKDSLLLLCTISIILKDIDSWHLFIWKLHSVYGFSYKKCLDYANEYLTHAPFRWNKTKIHTLINEARNRTRDRFSALDVTLQS